MGSTLVNLTESAEIVGIAKSEMSRRVKQGKAPQPIDRCGQSLIFNREVIEDYAEKVQKVEEAMKELSELRYA